MPKGRARDATLTEALVTVNATKRSVVAPSRTSTNAPQQHSNNSTNHERIRPNASQ
jgi:hypothetical protein